VRSLWSIIEKPKNRLILQWIGGGIIAIAGGAWAVVTYVWPAHEQAKIVCAQQGSRAAGRDVSGNTVNYNAGASAGAGSGGTAGCADTAKR
jgi:hypothetical protein